MSPEAFTHPFLIRDGSGGSQTYRFIGSTVLVRSPDDEVVVCDSAEMSGVSVALDRVLTLHRLGWRPLPTVGLRTGDQSMVLPTQEAKPWLLYVTSADRGRVCRFLSPDALAAPTANAALQRIAYDYYGAGDPEILAWQLVEVLQANTQDKRTIICGESCSLATLTVHRPAPADSMLKVTCVSREDDPVDLALPTVDLLLQLEKVARTGFQRHLHLPTLEADIVLDPATAQFLHSLLTGVPYR